MLLVGEIARLGPLMMITTTIFGEDEWASAFTQRAQTGGTRIAYRAVAGGG